MPACSQEKQATNARSFLLPVPHPASPLLDEQLTNTGIWQSTLPVKYEEHSCRERASGLQRDLNQSFNLAHPVPLSATWPTRV